MNLQKYQNIRTGEVFEAIRYTHPDQSLPCHKGGTLLKLGDWVIVVRQSDNYGGGCFSIRSNQQFKEQYKLWNSSSCNNHGKLTHLNSTLKQGLEQCFKKLKAKLANS